MREKKWKITYKNEPWSIYKDGLVAYCMGFFEITFEGDIYGSISKELWDDKKTDYILDFVEQMLNDAHDLALKVHE